MTENDNLQDMIDSMADSTADSGHIIHDFQRRFLKYAPTVKIFAFSTVSKLAISIMTPSPKGTVSFYYRNIRSGRTIRNTYRTHIIHDFLRCCIKRIFANWCATKDSVPSIAPHPKSIIVVNHSYA